MESGMRLARPQVKGHPNSRLSHFSSKTRECWYEVRKCLAHYSNTTYIYTTKKVNSTNRRSRHLCSSVYLRCCFLIESRQLANFTPKEGTPAASSRGLPTSDVNMKKKKWVAASCGVNWKKKPAHSAHRQSLQCFLDVHAIQWHDKRSNYRGRGGADLSPPYKNV